MRCKKEHTDQEVDFTMHANGVACREYSLLTSTNTDPNVVECFIPVEEGDQLTLRGSFTGSCLHGSFDLLADGSFLGDKRIEGPKSGDVKRYDKRKLDIKTVFDAPKEPGYSSINPPDKIVEGNMHAKALRGDYDTTSSTSSSTVLGFGTLAVIVSLNQRTDENYGTKYRSITCGDADLDRSDAGNNGGIPPTYELEVKVPTDDEVSKTRQSKHKRHAEQTRFGDQPWAQLIFYYRSKEAIKSADCVEVAKDAVHQLEPGNAETFIHGTIEMKKPSKKAKAGEKQPTPAPDTSMQNSLFMRQSESVKLTPATSEAETLKATPAPSEPASKATPQPAAEFSTPKAPSRQQLASSSTPSAPSPSNKKKLFGQSLNLPDGYSPSPRVLHGREEPAGDDFSTAMADYHRERQKEEDETHQQVQTDIPPFATFNQTAVAPQHRPELGAETETLLRAMSDEELADAISDAEAFLGNRAPVAQMLNPEEEGTDVDVEIKSANELPEQVRVKVEEQDQEPLAASPHADPTKRPVSPPYMAALAATSAPTALTAPVAAPDAVISASQALLEQTGGSLESRDNTMASPSPSPSHDSSQSDQPCALTTEDIRAHIPTEGIKLSELKSCFADDVLPHNRQAASDFVALVKQVAYNKNDRYYIKSASQVSSSQSQKTEPQRTPPSPTKPIPTKIERADSPIAPNTNNHLQMPASVPQKRTASTMSRESTPSSKKPRFDALATRKADIKRQLEEKQKRKAAAQQSLAEQQKLRENEKRR